MSTLSRAKKWSLKLNFTLNQLSLLKISGVGGWGVWQWCKVELVGANGVSAFQIFLSLERETIHGTKCIAEQRVPKKTTITKLREILNKENRFYKVLQASTGVSPDDRVRHPIN